MNILLTWLFQRILLVLEPHGQNVLYLVPKSKLRNEYYMLHVNHFSYLFTGDRSHVIERSLNRRTGDEDRKQNFINLDESEFGHVIFFSQKYFS